MTPATLQRFLSVSPRMLCPTATFKHQQFSVNDIFRDYFHLFMLVFSGWLECLHFCIKSSTLWMQLLHISLVRFQCIEQPTTEYRVLERWGCWPFLRASIMNLQARHSSCWLVLQCNLLQEYAGSPQVLLNTLTVQLFIYFFFFGRGVFSGMTPLFLRPCTYWSSLESPSITEIKQGILW